MFSENTFIAATATAVVLTSANAVAGHKINPWTGNTGVAYHYAVCSIYERGGPCKDNTQEPDREAASTAVGSTCRVAETPWWPPQPYAVRVTNKDTGTVHQILCGPLRN